MIRCFFGCAYVAVYEVRMEYILRRERLYDSMEGYDASVRPVYEASEEQPRRGSKEEGDIHNTSGCGKYPAPWAQQLSSSIIPAQVPTPNHIHNQQENGLKGSTDDSVYGELCMCLGFLIDFLVEKKSLSQTGWSKLQSSPERYLVLITSIGNWLRCRYFRRCAPATYILDP